MINKNQVEQEKTMKSMRVEWNQALWVKMMEGKILANWAQLKQHQVNIQMKEEEKTKTMMKMIFLWINLTTSRTLWKLLNQAKEF